jgi:predicted phage tail component-like protein
MVDNGGFTIDGIPASTYGVELAYAPGQPFLPSTRDRTVEITGRAGNYWFDSDLGPRTFSLPCRFTGCADAAALDVLIRAFARIFTHVRGKPRQLALIFDDSTDVSYMVRYNGQIPFDRAWVGCSEFTLELIADDPYAYEPEDDTTISPVTTSGSIAGTVTSSGEVETPAEICITNNGGAAVDGFEIKVIYEVT